MLASAKEAEDLKIIDMRQVSNFCDFFVILSASSSRRAKTISEYIQEGLQKKHIPVRGQEGNSDSRWTLLDLFDVVVHIFYGPTREFYNLEKLWQDAPTVKLPGKIEDDHKPTRRPAKRPAPRINP